MIYRVHKEDTIRMHEYNFGITGGVRLLQKFYTSCQNFNEISHLRMYSTGVKSLLNNSQKDTIYVNSILISMDGMSPRLCLMR